MSRAVVVESDGTIAAVISGDARMFAAQSLLPGQDVFAILNDDGGLIDDRIWRVDENGAVAMKPGAVGEAPPNYELLLIAV
jgi:hypothetical protein